jgi:hemolysin activation/secretion protein
MGNEIVARKLCKILILSLCLSQGLPSATGAVEANTIPGPADIGRIKPEQKLPTIGRTKGSAVTPPPSLHSVEIPEGATAIQFELKAVDIEGVSAFKPDQLSDIYMPYIDKAITLDTLYLMADAITLRYRNAGYFLSLAYIPQQQINGGIVKIKVVEGSIVSVKLESWVANQTVVRAYIDQLKVKKPLKSQDLESFLLRLNDLPGYKFKAVISSLNGDEEGAEELTLTDTDKTGTVNINFDNYGSRFLGPHQAWFSYSNSLLSLQQTSVFFLSSLQSNEIKYGALSQSIVFAPGVTAGFAVSYIKARPGYTLKPFDIQSNAIFYSTNLNYQLIRQRKQNLELKLTLDGRNSSTDISDVALSRDHIRALRAQATYDTIDRWQGYNVLNFALSRGISNLGSSRKGDKNLSRDEARPDFTKFEVSFARLQTLSQDYSLLMTAAFQRAAGPLYAAEEFGYGGQAFGRAYDSSEISGDHGAAGSIELRYEGWSHWSLVRLSPYAFYDIGVVWNDDRAQAKSQSGASAGFGVRVSTDMGMSGTLGLAWPLTRDIETPIYARASRQPRIMFQFGHSF